MADQHRHLAGVSRRGFLALAAGIALVGCSRGIGTVNEPEYRPTARELLEADTFFIAHRGSGDNWTEHTLHAYRQAVAHGAPAVEISVHRTLDGHFVCHHDPSLLRLCGVQLRIKDLTLEQLSGYRNDASAWLGPNVPSEPIPTLGEVLEQIGGQAVLFIEDKTGQYATELLDALEQSAAPVQTVIWKQPCSGAGYRQASERGYLTWGYFAPEEFDRIESLAGQFDAIGIHDSADQATIDRAVSTGKPVICWEVHTRSQLQALQRSSVAGMMCSNYPYVSSGENAGPVLADDFASGLRAAGDLPDVMLWKAQPQILARQAAVRLPGDRKSSYVLGSMASTAPGSWELKARMRWPSLGGENQVAGIGFGVPNDAPYRAYESHQQSGFHVQLESEGRVSLWQARGSSPLLLGRQDLDRALANHWHDLQMRMSDGMLEVTVGGVSFAAPLEQPVPPGYLNLLTLMPGGYPVDFQGIELRLAAA